MVGIDGAAEFVSFSPPPPILTPQVVLWDSAQRKDTWFDWSGGSESVSQSKDR